MLWAWLLFAALGAVAGLAGTLYNSALLGALSAAALSAADGLARWPAEIRAAVIGAVVGIIGWFLSSLIGGDDNITQRLLADGASLTLLLLPFLLRFGLGPVSYAAATPGGLFAPILVLGTQLGPLCGALCGVALPDMKPDPTAFPVVGMEAFFTGVVQAPVTGIVLVIEMTARRSQLAPAQRALARHRDLPHGRWPNDGGGRQRRPTRAGRGTDRAPRPAGWFNLRATLAMQTGARRA